MTTAFIEKIKANLLRLPLKKAHQEIAPYRKNTLASLNPEKEIKSSAVLLLLFSYQNEIQTVLIKRSHYEGIHSDQVSLPGGQFEAKDENLQQTALRETNEELGISSEKIQIIGALSEIFIPPSNFRMKPFVGFMNEIPKIKSDNREVADYFMLPIKELLKNDAIKTETVIASSNHLKMKVPCFVYRKNIIWGATAMVLNELRYLLR